jgi:hypothetical protein
LGDGEYSLVVKLKYNRKQLNKNNIMPKAQVYFENTFSINRETIEYNG